MLPGLYSAATGLSAAELNQEVIARNLAHVNVPGFRRGVLPLETFDMALRGESASDVSVTGLGTRSGEVHTDFTPGPVQHTGRSLDLALAGDGFFVVEGPEGPLYTRNGVFQLNESGQLVTNDGRPVQGERGTIQLPANTSPSQVRVSLDGTIQAEGVQVGKIKVVSFADNQQLVPVGTTLFQSPDGVAAETGDSTVVQGAREMSNVAAVEELVRMIVGMRHYEASQKAIQTIGDAIQQSTNPQAG